MHPYPLVPIGGFFQSGAFILTGVLGFLDAPILTTALIGSLLFSVGYICIRAPQMWGGYRSDGAKILLVFFYLLVGNSMLSAIPYGVGRLISWAIN